MINFIKSIIYKEKDKEIAILQYERNESTKSLSTLEVENTLLKSKIKALEITLQETKSSSERRKIYNDNIHQLREEVTRLRIENAENKKFYEIRIANLNACYEEENKANLRLEKENKELRISRESSLLNYMRMENAYNALYTLKKKLQNAYNKQNLQFKKLLQQSINET